MTIAHEHASTTPADAAWLDRLLDPEIERALGELAGEAPLLSLMARYHLGIVDSTGRPLEGSDRRSVQGKRIRPLLALLSCMASGGSAESAVPLAAGIELLHNFTLVHDDIQDRSPNRRHRATVWRIWGDAQAINAGDAIFAASNLSVLATSAKDASLATVHRLVTEFNRITIAIVGGQVRDLDFEGKGNVRPEDYLEMISGKTGAILRYAAWAGSIIGGASERQADAFARMGLALGIGFQIRDDLLGIWGTREETGKEVADDIRRRKQSLPILLLRAQASPEETEILNALYAGDEIDETGIATVLALLDANEIRQQVLDQVESTHQDAIDALASIARADVNEGFVAISRLIERMRVRIS